MLVFYPAALNAVRSSREKGVRPSVRLSVCLSVCLSVRLSNAWIVIKRKKNVSRFFILCESLFSLVFREKRMVGRGRTILSKILGQNDHVGAKSPIFSRSSPVAPQP